MLARRGSQILAFTKRDAVRLGFLSTLLVAGLTFVLAFDDLTSMTEAGDLVAIFGWLLLAIAVVTILMAWMWRFRSRLWHRNNAMLLVALALLTATALLVILSESTVAPYLVPTFAVALLLSVLLDSGVASVVTAIVAIMAGVITGSTDLAAYAFLGGLAGTIVIGRGERLSQFVQAGVAITAANVAVVVAFTIISGSDDVEVFLQLLAASAVSAFSAAIAAAGTFAVLGSLFGITTSYQLLELANPTQPLLRRLLLEAPGTYHHSLMVGNLAEQAAEAIGADALVTRVAAYYHDVGKLYDPMLFIENQAGGENIHDQLPPEESAAMIVGHVARGIDIAYQYKLPKALIPYIPQHHGTALMGYFYAKARQIAADEAGTTIKTEAGKQAADKVDPRRFRHAGPKPQTREAAILMLADSVEASVRSLASHEEPAIRAMVSQIISDRLIDGQFDECDLTLRDLDRIRESFIEQLLAMYHRRIAYPTNKIVELESRRPVEQKGLEPDHDAMSVELTVRPGVPGLLAEDECRLVLEAAIVAGGAPDGATIGLTLSDDAELAALNTKHMGKAGPTDVLSFPLLPPSAFPEHPGQDPNVRAVVHEFPMPPGEAPHLGDVIVSVERAIEQAHRGAGGQTSDVRWAPADELRLLITHGGLHVCGWDHARPEEERAMRALERDLLGLDIGDSGLE